MVTTSKYYFGGTAKMISDHTSEGYLVSYTNEKKRDLHREWFDASTDFLVDVSPILGKMILLNHGIHKNIGTIPTGEITHVEMRDDGIYVRKEDRFREQFTTYAKNRAPIQTLKPAKEFLDEFLYEVDEYEKMLIDLRASGYFKFSSGALPQSVITDPETGHIKRWQIIEGSETGTPAEPRMLTRIHTGKSFELLGLPYLVPQSKGVYPIPLINNQPQDGQPKEAHEPIEELATVNDGGKPNIQVPNEVKTMSDDKTPVTQPVKTGEESNEQMIARMIKEALAQQKAQVQENDKMADEDKDKDKEQKSAPDIKSAIREIFAEMNSESEAKQAEQDALKSAIAETVKAELQGFKPNYARDDAGSRTSEKTATHISVAEPEEYRHLTADEMALGVKLAYAKMSPIDKRSPHVNIGTIFTETYIKSLAHKMQIETKSMRSLDPRDTIGQFDHADIKSAVKNFTKADELNASDITGQGDEYATTFYDARLWDRVRESTQLFNLLQARGMRTLDLPQGSESMEVYLVTSSGTVYTGRQANSTNGIGRPETTVDIEAIGTDKINQPLAKHTLAYGITYELEERSIINVVSIVNEDMGMTLAEALEDALINGDTTMTASTNINLNDGTPATTAHGQTPLYIAWDGIRHAYMVDHTARKDDHGSGLSVVDFEAVIQLLDNKFRTRKSNMLFILDTKTESAMRLLPELLTRDTSGDRMTMFTGAIPPMSGVDIYTSGFMPRTGTAGTISSAGSENGANVKGGIGLVYAPFWQYGRQRNIMIEADKDIVAQTTVMVASVTHAFRRRGDNAAAGKYNITVV